jgi:signal transduction histidine kinase
LKKLFLVVLPIVFLVACQQPNPKRAKVDWTVYKKAYAFLSRQNDSAFYYFNQVAAESKDSLQIAMSYNIMAMIQSDAGDYYGAQESLSLALKLLDEKQEKDRATLANVYNELGMSSTNLKNYTAAVDFFDKAIQLGKDENLKSLSLNNKALAYQKKKDYSGALQLYRQLIRKTKPNGTEYARILTNLATTAWLNDSRYPAAPDLLKALAIRRREKDLWGLNSSYLSLAAYYADNRPDSALAYAKARYDMARELHSPDDRLEALAMLVKVAPETEVKRYFSLYQQLGDSLQTNRNTAKNQFALIRYNVERSKAENLRLQKDNAEEKYGLLIRNVLLVTALLILAGGAVRVRAILRRRKIRQEQEKWEAIQETRRKASKDVHDSLSNDIYLLMKRIKHDAVLDRDWLRQHTEFLYRRSRNISYEILSDNEEFFSERLGELLKSFGTDETKVSLVGNSPALWQKVAPDAKLELKYILQELLVNMQKHSGAANVVVKFEVQGASGLITYMDDGVGMPENTVHQNGLTNTETRINAIRGRITFGDNDGKGLKIVISFPFN